jgi:hypothetical protein
MKQFLIDSGIISVLAIALGVFMWALCGMQKCSNCGHKEEDHIHNGCIECDCKEHI